MVWKSSFFDCIKTGTTEYAYRQHTENRYRSLRKNPSRAYRKRSWISEKCGKWWFPIYRSLVFYRWTYSRNLLFLYWKYPNPYQAIRNARYYICKWAKWDSILQKQRISRSADWCRYSFRNNINHFAVNNPISWWCHKHTP